MKFLSAMLLIMALALTAACGSSNDNSATTASGAATVATGAVTEVSDAATEVTSAVTEAAPSGDEEAAKRGETIAKAQCATCHSFDGTKIVGPSWKGIWGHEVEMEDGSKVKVDEAYIHESIVDPNAKIVKGYPAVMTSYNGLLSDDQINDIIAYIKTLQ